MSDNKIFSRSKASELLQELEVIDKKSKNAPLRNKIVLKKIIANITIGNTNEMVALFPQVLQLYQDSQAAADLETKKLICFYFVTYCGVVARKELAERALELLYKDLLNSGSGPGTDQCLVLSTISSINLQLPRLVKLVSDILELDSTEWPAPVKQKACFAIAKIYDYDSNLASQHHLLTLLNDQLYNDDITIVTTALAALNDITERNEHLQMRINTDHAVSLLDKVNYCNEWSTIYVLNAMMSFIPQTDDEALLVMERCLPLLQHENSSVVLNALKVIIYVGNYVKRPQDVIPSLSKRLGSTLVSLLSKPPEIQFLVLRNIILLLLSKPDLLDFDIIVFFCKYDDPIYVKDTKLEIIYLLADEENIDVALEELQIYATDVDIQMSRKAVRAIGNLAVKLDTCHHSCIGALNDLINNGISYILQESAIVVQNILRKYRHEGFEKELITNLIQFVDIIDEPESKTSMVWIIGNYCTIIPQQADILLNKYGTENFEEEANEFQLAFLTAVVKYYLQMPSKESSEICVRYLKIATELINNPDTRERGFFYWRLISSGNGGDFDTVKEMLTCPLPAISTENEKLDHSILEELELNIGTLASIYLKPVKQVFRLSKQKSLPHSAALQPRDADAYRRRTRKKKASSSEKSSRSSSVMLAQSRNKNGAAGSSANMPLEENSIKSPATGITSNGRFEDNGYYDDSVEPLRRQFDRSASIQSDSNHNNGSGSKLSRKLSMSFKKNIETKFKR